jgi:ketosteroid isomerase-like protein
MRRRDLLTAGAGCCASSLSAQPSRSAAVEAVQAAIRTYYSVWESGDANRYAGLLTTDYVLLEHGVPMKMEDDLKMAPKPESKRRDSFEFRATHVVGEVAYAYWFLNSTTIDEKGTPSDGRWLESGVLRRSKGAWKVALLHSTRIEKRA